MLLLNVFMFIENLSINKVYVIKDNKVIRINNYSSNDKLNDWDPKEGGQYVCGNLAQTQWNNLLSFLQRTNTRQLVLLKIDQAKAVAIFQAVNNHE